MVEEEHERNHADFIAPSDNPWSNEIGSVDLVAIAKAQQKEVSPEAAIPAASEAVLEVETKKVDLDLKTLRSKIAEGASEVQKYLASCGKGTPEEVREEFDNPTGRLQLKEEFEKKLYQSMQEKQAVPFDAIGYLEGFGHIGVDLRRITGDRYVQMKMEEMAVANVFHEGRGRSEEMNTSPQKLLNYAEAWKIVGVDALQILNKPEIQARMLHALRNQIHQRIQPENFIQWAAEWKQVGIDLVGLLRDPEVQKMLEESHKNFKPRYKGEKSYRDRLREVIKN